MTDLIKDNFGMTLDEILNWKSEGRKSLIAENGTITRLNLSKTFPHAAIRSAEVLRAVTPLFSEAGYASAICVWQELQRKAEASEILEHTLERLYTDPVLLKDKTLWILIQVLLRSQQLFTSKSCSSPTKEETLTGALLGTITTHASVWKEKGEKLLHLAGAKLHIGSIDLQIDHREGKTGGDFGLIVEYERDHKIFYLPLIFQAKRYYGTTADVSQFHNERGYQYATLNNQQCATAYLFYHNGPTKIIENVPPLVKLARETDHPDIRKNTPVGDKSVDFFSFVMKAIAGGSDFPTADNEKDALSMIVATATVEELVAIVAFARSDETLPRLQSAYDAITGKHNLGKEASDDELVTNNDRKPKV